MTKSSCLSLDVQSSVPTIIYLNYCGHHSKFSFNILHNHTIIISVWKIFYCKFKVKIFCRWNFNFKFMVNNYSNTIMIVLLNKIFNKIFNDIYNIIKKWRFAIVNDNKWCSEIIVNSTISCSIKRLYVYIYHNHLNLNCP